MYNQPAASQLTYVGQWDDTKYKLGADICPKIHIANKTRPLINHAPPIVPAPKRKVFTKTRGD